MNIRLLEIVLIAAFLAGGTLPLMAEDYEYQYFKQKGNKFVPFSDYIPKVRFHYLTVPHYVEDYYLLYGMKQYYNENTLRKNIEKLKTALNCKFRHPSNALIKPESEEEYLKYRRLMFMHINILILRNYLKIAARYDKQTIVFFNRDFHKEITESLGIAENLYREAIPYWEKAREYAYQASRIKITTDLGYIESERYSIIHGDTDYGKIIQNDIAKIQVKKSRLNALASSAPSK